MISGWWLLAAFWIGGYAGILLVVLRATRYEVDPQHELRSGGPELPLGGEQAIPKS